MLGFPGRFLIWHDCPQVEEEKCDGPEAHQKLPHKNRNQEPVFLSFCRLGTGGLDLSISYTTDLYWKPLANMTCLAESGVFLLFHKKSFERPPWKKLRLEIWGFLRHFDLHAALNWMFPASGVLLEKSVVALCAPLRICETATLAS